MSRTIFGLTLNYRDAAATTRCIQSLLDNGVERVLVWDNSADGGFSAEQLLKLWSWEKRVTIKVSPNNLGFAAGVNRALEQIQQQCPTAWVFLINNDAIVRPEGLKELSRVLSSHQKAKIAYSAFKQDGGVIGTRYYHRYLGLLSSRPFPGTFPYPTGCALLLALDRLDLPLFDEDFFMYGEDCLLGWQYGEKNIVFVPHVLVDHQGSGASHIGSSFYENHLVAGHWILAKKLARNSAEYLFLCLGRLLTLSMRALVRALRYRSMTPIKALWQGWRIAHGKDTMLNEPD